MPISLSPVRASLLFVGLVALGLAANYVTIRMFFGVEFQFGAVLALVAVRLLGLPLGVVAAALIASYTYYLWEHPYAALILTLEAGLVGWWTRRRQTFDFVLPDAVFWLLVGVPSVYGLYLYGLGMDLQSTTLMALKQLLNGVLAALLATLLLMHVPVKRWLTGSEGRPVLSFHAHLFQILTTTFLLTGLILLALVSRVQYQTMESRVQRVLNDQSDRASQLLEHWEAQILGAAETLHAVHAEEAGAVAGLRTQAALEALYRATAPLVLLQLIDDEGRVLAQAHDPQRSGGPAPGLSALPAGASDDEPVLSDLLAEPQRSDVEGSDAQPLAAVPPARAVLTIPRRRGEGGATAVRAVLDLDALRQSILGPARTAADTRITLVDGVDRIAWSSHPPAEVMPLLGGQSGQVLQRFDDRTYHWAPRRSPGRSVAQRRLHSHYVRETPWGPSGTWRLIVDVPSQPYREQLYGQYIGNMVVGVALVLIGLLLAGVAARRMILPVHQLAQLTTQLPERIDGSEDIEFWPQSRIADIETLTRNFRDMSLLLGSKFRELHNLNTQLRDSNEKLKALIEASPLAIYTLDGNGTVMTWNRAAEKMFGWREEEVLGKLPPILSPQDRAEFVQLLEKVLSGRGFSELELRRRRKDGSPIDISLSAAPLFGSDACVSGVMSIALDITERKRTAEENRFLALYDPLTQLPNRRLLMDKLQRALNGCTRGGTRGAVVFLDLDHFKNLNDISGHQEGDKLLRQVASRLRSVVRSTDTVARFGGDEFVLILRELSGQPEEAAKQALLISKKCLALFDEPFGLTRQDYRITASLGLTVFGDAHDDPDEVIKQADLAMYQSKCSGRRTLRLYDRAMQADMKRRVRMEAELRSALDGGSIVPYYQPQVDLQGAITGAEALARWLHPTRGMVYPAEFIDVAEETDLIKPLGRAMLEQVCVQVAEWAGRWEGRPPGAVAVNVSVRQFHDPGFVPQVLEVMERTGIDPRLLQLELTESLLLEDMESAIVKMNALKAEGITFSLDDFGIGYSSLTYLRLLPIDLIKIDSSFVGGVLTDSNDATIARSIIVLAQSLGLNVVAEGVETREIRDFLAEHGCRVFQGHLFSPPLPAEEFNRFVAKAFRGGD